MAEIMLVNPRRRKRRRKMSAKQARYFGKRRRRARASAAPRRRRRRRSNPVAFLNPRRRRSRRSITRGYKRRRRHSNPSFRNVTGSALPMIKEGFTGALGALGLDVLWGYSKSYLPATIAGSPLAQYAAKLVGAILIGMVGGRVPGLRGRGRALAVGAATVVLHDALKAQVQASFPTIPLGEYLTYAPTVGSMPYAGRVLSSGIPSDGMGEYLSGIPNDGSGGTNDDMSYTGEWNGDGMNG